MIQLPTPTDGIEQVPGPVPPRAIPRAPELPPFVGAGKNQAVTKAGADPGHLQQRVV